MALTDENGMVMPVAPMYSGGAGSGFGSGFGGDGWWIILLFIILGGWGRGFGGYGAGGGVAGGNELYPWLNQTETVNDGFRDQMLNNNITSVRDGINALSTQLCNCCSDMQMANMNSAFGIQNALNQGFNATQAQLASCCCENRLGTADLKYTIATENCADRQALNEGVRDIIANQTSGIQRILDQLCADKIDAKNDTIAQLRQELLFARGQASQDVQTAELRANNATVANQLLSEMRSCPIPAQPVYGTQPIFTCNNSGCGCGCNNGSF